MSSEDQQQMSSVEAMPEAPRGHATHRTAQLIGAVSTVAVLAALAVGAYALVRADSWGDARSRLPDRFRLDLQTQVTIPPELLKYSQTAVYQLSLEQPRALATGPAGSIYVAGARSIVALSAEGKQTQLITVEEPPSCLAVASSEDGRPPTLYAGMGQHIGVFNAEGKQIARWPTSSDESVLTAMVLGEDELLVADAGQRLVLRIGLDGQLRARVGQSDPDRQMPGFVIPSPYFDLVAGPGGSVYVVNPGARRIECYAKDGQLQSFWGHAGSAIQDFFGCCNPAHLAILPDGRFVTSEKGIPRIKVYSAGGDFEAVVAGPTQLGVNAAAVGDARDSHSERVFDVAVDAAGRILALDARHRCIRVFEPK